MDFQRPPCWPDGHPCPNPCARQHHAAQVYNHAWLTAEWTGWHMAGARLVSPSKDWITAPVLDRLIYRRRNVYRID